LLKTATLEHPKIIGQVILVEPGAAAPDIVTRLRNNAHAGAPDGPFRSAASAQGEGGPLNWPPSAHAVAGERSEWRPVPHQPDIALLSDSLVRYARGKRQVAAWQEIPLSAESPAPPWKDGGVYLITGGAGGLGRIFAGEIAACAKEVTIILVG